MGQGCQVPGGMCGGRSWAAEGGTVWSPREEAGAAPHAAVLGRWREADMDTEPPSLDSMKNGSFWALWGPRGHYLPQSLLPISCDFLHAQVTWTVTCLRV